MSESLTDLLSEVRACKICESSLPRQPNPVLRASESARILIVGQAPGIKVHESGIPWNDASGERLRDWLGLSAQEFYDERKVAILPVGFCYPGKASQGDLPPRRECFPLWHPKLLSCMPQLKLKVLLGSYAHRSYLKGARKNILTETVRAWREFLPEFLPLPHPSPLNNIWLSKNQWFYDELEEVKKMIQSIMLQKN